MRTYVLESKESDISYIPVGSAVFKDNCVYIKHEETDLIWDDLKKYKAMCLRGGEYDPSNPDLALNENGSEFEYKGIKFVISGEYEQGLGATITELNFYDRLGRNVNVSNKTISELNLFNPEYYQSSTDWSFNNMFNGDLNYIDQESGKSSSALFNVGLNSKTDESSFLIEMTAEEIGMLKEIEISAGSIENRVPYYIAVYLAATTGDVLLNRIDFINANGDLVFGAGLITLSAKRGDACKDLAAGGATKSGIYYLSDPVTGKMVPRYCGFDDNATGLTQIDLTNSGSSLLLLDNCDAYIGDKSCACKLKNILNIISSLKKNPKLKIAILNPLNDKVTEYNPSDYFKILGIDFSGFSTIPVENNDVLNLLESNKNESTNSDLVNCLIDYITRMDQNAKDELGLSDGFSILDIARNLSLLSISKNSVLCYTDDSFEVVVSGYYLNDKNNLNIFIPNADALDYTSEEFFTLIAAKDEYGNSIIDQSTGEQMMDIISNMKFTFSSTDLLDENDIVFDDGYSVKKLHYYIKQRKLTLTNLPENWLKISSDDQPYKIGYYGKEGEVLNIIEQTNATINDYLTIDIKVIDEHSGILTINAKPGEKLLNFTLDDGFNSYNLKIQVYNKTYFLVDGVKTNTADIGNVYVDYLIDGVIDILTLINVYQTPFLERDEETDRILYYEQNYSSLNFTFGSVDSDKSMQVSLKPRNTTRTNNLGNFGLRTVELKTGYFVDGSYRPSIYIKYAFKKRLRLNGSLNETFNFKVNLISHNLKYSHVDFRLTNREGTIKISNSDTSVCAITGAYTDNGSSMIYPGGINYRFIPKKLGTTTATITDGKSTKTLEIYVLQWMKVDSRPKLIDLFDEGYFIEVEHPNLNTFDFISENSSVVEAKYIYNSGKHYIKLTPISVGTTNLLVDDKIKQVEIEIKVENLSNRFYIKKYLKLDIYLDYLTTTYEFPFTNKNSNGVVTLDFADSNNVEVMLNESSTGLKIKRKSQDVQFTEPLKITYAEPDVNYTEVINCFIQTENKSFAFSENPVIFYGGEDIPTRKINVIREKAPITFYNDYSENIIHVTDNYNDDKSFLVDPKEYGSTKLHFTDPYNEEFIDVFVKHGQWGFSDNEVVFLSTDEINIKYINILDVPFDGFSDLEFDPTLINVDIDGSVMIITRKSNSVFKSIIKLRDVNMKEKTLDVYYSNVGSDIILVKQV